MSPMTLRTEPSARWVRAYAGDAPIVDSRRSLLFWEERFPVPACAIPEEDVRLDLLTHSAAPERWHPFFGPHGPVSAVWDLRIGDLFIPAVAWRRDDPALAGHVVLTWLPGTLHWTEEDEPVFGHPRDPHKRVDALPSSRHVVVSLDGTVLAETNRPVTLFETGLPTRYYFPPEDVRFDELTAVEHVTGCPYKGIADRYWSRPGLDNFAWSYREPTPAVGRIKDRVAFYNELVDITVDGVLEPRPQSPFSTDRP